LDREVKKSVWIEDALYVKAYLNDFSGNVHDWKNAVYELFRYNMTWGFAYQIDVLESRGDGVFVQMHCSPSYEKSISEMMDDLGFKNVNVERESIGVVETYDFPDDLSVWFVRAD